VLVEDQGILKRAGRSEIRREKYIAEALETVKLSNIQGWFKHCRCQV